MERSNHKNDRIITASITVIGVLLVLYSLLWNIGNTI